VSEQVRVLDKGYVSLVQSQASDLSVVAAARVSLGVTEEASKGERDDRRLIRYLLRHHHGTPFEHNLFTFLVKAPIFVVREWHRHRVGWSYNEVSGRYTEMESEFYVPSEVRVPAASNRQGSVVAEPGQVAINAIGAIQVASLRAFDAYHRLLAHGVAKEQARLVLPLNTYTSFYASCNARSLMHFLGLRDAEDAQWEIRQYAQAMGVLFQESMPITAEEFHSLRFATTPSPSLTTTLSSDAPVAWVTGASTGAASEGK
jgi:thymidylate synthase (FAD)